MQVSLSQWFRAFLRDNRLHDQRVALLRANERLPPDALHLREELLLRKTLMAAKKQLGAYRDLIVPKEELIRFLQTLPIVTKHELLTDRRNYAPSLGPRRLWTSRGLTSGTTGTPLEMYRSLNSIIWESAFIARHWSWSDFASPMRRATLRGDNVVPASRESEPFWYYNRAENELLLSSRHLRPPYINSIIDELRKFKPSLLQAYPSTAFELALQLERTGEYLHIPSIYTSSEMLYSHQRELISSRLNARVMDHYGMAERVAFITECENGSYHVNTDYSYVEIVDDAGNPTRDIGYLVGTTFHNATMPLVRYRLSDRTRWKEGVCVCGRNYPMVDPIEGKYEDTIYGSSGNPVSPSIITFAFKGLRNIERSQIAQLAHGHWELRVVPLAGFGESERLALVKNIHELVDPNIFVTVVECKDIPRTSAGKYRWVVNEWTASGPPH